MADVQSYDDADVITGTSAGRPVAGRKTRAQRIAETERKLASLRAAEAKVRRKAEDRRKVMVGVAVEIEMRRDPEFKVRMAQIMRRNLTKPEDILAVSEWLTTT